MDSIIKIYIYIIIFIFILIIAYFFNLQVIKPKINLQYKNNYSNVIRGTIYFSDNNGENYPVAITNNKYDLVIDPAIVEDADELYEHINSVIPIDKEKFYKNISNKNSRYFRIIKKLDKKQYASLREKQKVFKLLGLELYRQNDRLYPFGDMAAHLIGFIGEDGNDKGLRGLYGLEKQYDNLLTGKEGASKDVYTTIDINTQRFLEKELKLIQDTWDSQQTMGIIANPKTGEVYAMGIYPTFNLTEFNTIEDYSVFQNNIVEGRYELGSVFKPITVAIGLQSKKIDTDFTYNDTGSITIDGATIYNYDKKGRGEETTLQQIIENSLNTGAVSVLLETGFQTYKNYLGSYRFEDLTEVNLPNEISGITNLDSEIDIDILTMSYGHGLAVTPIAAIKAFSSLANGGRLIEPRVVREGYYENKREEIQIFSEETLDEVIEMMVRSVDNVLLGGTFKNENYSIAGKTGTASLLDESGKYLDDRNLHSYFGFFPAVDPQFTVLLITIDPKEVDYASRTLSEPFFKISNFLLDYHSIAPDR